MGGIIKTIIIYYFSQILSSITLFKMSHVNSQNWYKSKGFYQAKIQESTENLI